MDQYYKYEIAGVSVAQARAFESEFRGLDLSGATHSYFGYSATTQVLKIGLGGPNIASAKSAIETQISKSFSRSADVSSVDVKGSLVTTSTDRAARLG